MNFRRSASRWQLLGELGKEIGADLLTGADRGDRRALELKASGLGHARHERVHQCRQLLLVERLGINHRFPSAGTGDQDQAADEDAH